MHFGEICRLPFGKIFYLRYHLSPWYHQRETAYRWLRVTVLSFLAKRGFPIMRFDMNIL